MQRQQKLTIKTANSKTISRLAASRCPLKRVLKFTFLKKEKVNTDGEKSHSDADQNIVRLPFVLHQTGFHNQPHKKRRVRIYKTCRLHRHSGETVLRSDTGKFRYGTLIAAAIVKFYIGHANILHLIFLHLQVMSVEN